MRSKLAVVFIAVGAGIAAAIGAVFASSFETEMRQQQDSATNTDPLSPIGQPDVSDGLAEPEKQSDPSIANNSGSDTLDVTDPEGGQGLPVLPDNRTINIITKIDTDMDLIIVNLGKTRGAVESNDYEIALGHIEDARVGMSKVVGQQRQLLIILEGGKQSSSDGDADEIQSNPEGSDSRLAQTAQSHLTIFEHIVARMDSISNMISESRQLWNQKGELESETAQDSIAELVARYQEKVKTPLQGDLSTLANLSPISYAGNSAITADTKNIIEQMFAIYEGDLKSLESLSEVESESYPPSMFTSAEDLKRLEQLREYALDKINDDRKNFDLPPVALSNSIASQIHAEDVFRTGKISHWMTNGEKPYMTYTRTGGSDSVFQNIAIGGYWNYEACLSESDNDCTIFNPYESIDTLEYEMVYNDVECCDDGHKYNILDPDHNLVSIGIAYNDYFFVIVQNFENDYVELDAPILGGGKDDDPGGTLVNITGEISQGYRVFGITINYDELPSRSGYELNKDKNYYDGGETIAAVQPTNASIDYEKEYLVGSSYSTIEATTWIEKNSGYFGIEFDLSEIKNDATGLATKDGVYTIMLWIQDEWDSDVFTAMTYSVFLD
jgi:uncharacterized protein YkwD